MKDEAIVAFNNIMSMETFSLLDDEKQSSLRDEISLYEMYKTRLVRVDLGARSRHDPLQRCLHKYLRAFRYWRLSKSSKNNFENLGTFPAGYRWSYQNTIFIAEVTWRTVVAVVTAMFLVVPLCILTQEQRKDVQLGLISACIATFSLLVSATMKASSLEIMVVSAAYSAVLSVFVSNGPEKVSSN
jgi:predicted secreted protein